MLGRLLVQTNYKDSFLLYIDIIYIIYIGQVPIFHTTYRL